MILDVAHLLAKLGLNPGFLTVNLLLFPLTVLRERREYFCFNLVWKLQIRKKAMSGVDEVGNCPVLLLQIWTECRCSSGKPLIIACNQEMIFKCEGPRYSPSWILPSKTYVSSYVVKLQACRS